MKYVYKERELFDDALSRAGQNFLDKKRIAVYGTGSGGGKVYKYLVDEGLIGNLVAFIDRDDSPMIGKQLHEVIIGRLDDFITQIDALLVAAEVHHHEIVQRLHDRIDENGITAIDMFETRYGTKEIMEYVSYLEDIQYKKSGDYIEIDNDEYKGNRWDTKVIAWYLPQFYVTDYNNRFHGMGFTEWTNSSKTLPQFCGHYQPHIPYHCGYYDLSNYKSIKRQAEIAKRYGIYGFAIHYYWFNETTRMLDTPIRLLLDNKDIDINYMINWATEDWSMEWDDSFQKWNFSDSFIKQELPKDTEAFFDELLPYFRDNRYIKINGMPVFSVYKCDIFLKSDFKRFTVELRQCAEKRGIAGIYIMISTGSHCFDEDVEEWGADALVEYQPNYMCVANSLEKLYPRGYINPHFNGVILDTSDFFERRRYLSRHKSNEFFRCAVTAWDNTARRATSGARIVWGISPKVLEIWLADLMDESKKIHDSEKDYVFVSSWNEWAEGSHLEPDMRYGYAWLKAVRNALEYSRK